MDFSNKIVKIAFVFVTCTLLTTVCGENEEFDFEGTDLLFGKLLGRLEKLEARDKMREKENKDLKERVLYLESLTQQQQVEIKNMKEAAKDQTALNQQLQDRLQYLETRDSKRDTTETDLKIQKKRIQSLETLIRRLTRRFPNGRESQNDSEKDAQGALTQETEKKAFGIQTRRKRENEMTVAFYASLTNHIQNPGVHQIIAFDHVITNLGNGYNPHAGDFRAPVAGTYVFSTSLMAGYQTLEYHFKIMHNGNSVSNIYMHGGTSTQVVVLQLNQGDDVSIHNLDAGKTVYGSGYTIFSGFLLQQDFSSPVVVGK